MSEGHPFEDDTDDRVGVIVRDSNGRILIVQGVTGKYSFPKGSRKRAETEWEGAMREAWEETGIDLDWLLEMGFAKANGRRRLNRNLYYEFTLSSYGEYFTSGPKEVQTLGIRWVYPLAPWFQGKAPLNADLSLWKRKHGSGAAAGQHGHPRQPRKPSACAAI